MRNSAHLQLALKSFMEQLASLLGELKEVEQVADPTKLSKRTLLELVSHEGIVKEAYKDSKGIWTWGIGVTNASGHNVNRYKDNPQTLKRVIEVFEWLVRVKYLPDVEDAFEGFPLTEAQLAAALSFHYNTGAIKRATWVKNFKAGEIERAKVNFMQYRRPPEIIPRREKERDLFFDGKWSNNGTALLYEQVNKPSYTPKWSSAKRVNIEEELS